MPKQETTTEQPATADPLVSNADALDPTPDLTLAPSSEKVTPIANQQTAAGPQPSSTSDD
jgi:hypothetical protein